MTIEQRNDLLRRWVAALESGDYKQGSLCLRRVTDAEDEFCCLGVLCEVACIPWNLIGERSITAIYTYTDENGHRSDSDGFLPAGFERDLLGRGNRMTLRNPDDGRLLPPSVLNDNYELPFTKIAELVRERFPDAFKQEGA